MKVVLAANIFYPDVGGPATHIYRIAEALSKRGDEVIVVAYGSHRGEKKLPFPIYRVSRSLPGLFRWSFYFLKVLWFSFSANVVYAFDPTASGMPAYAAAYLLRKKFLMRIGGDPIWERAVESGRRFLPLEEYYAQGLARKDRPLLFLLLRSMLGRIQTIVTYNELLKNLYVEHFGVSPERIHIIRNPMLPHRESTKLPSPPVFLFAGRFVLYKNLHLVVRTFDALFREYRKGSLEIVGAGPDELSLKALARSLPSSKAISFSEPLPQNVLFERIRAATVCLAPALTEFNPNFILEGLSLGRPALVSRGNGLTVVLPSEWQFDPRREGELMTAMKRFYDSAYLAEAERSVSRIPLSVTWDDTIQAHFALVSSI